MEKGHFQALIPEEQAPKKVEFRCGCKPATHNGYANLASYKSHINAAYNNVPPIGSSHNKMGPLYLLKMICPNLNKNILETLNQII